MVLRFFTLAIALFFISCTDVNRDNPYDSGGTNYQGGDPDDPYNPYDPYDPALKIETITLSYAGYSYADIDDNSNCLPCPQAIAATIKNKIDLVAYNTMNAGDIIYSPYELDFFYDDRGWNFLGEYVEFYQLPSSAFSVLNKATKTSDVDKYFDSLDLDWYDWDTAVPIVKNTAFLVFTSEEDIKIVLITSIGSRSVDLKIIGGEWE